MPTTCCLPAAGSTIAPKQRWVALRYTGTDADINIETAEPEFCEWRWIAPRELVDLAVPFKRDVYQTLMDRFSGLIEG